MNQLKLLKERLPEILEAVRSQYRLVGPVLEDEYPVFKEIQKADDLVLGDALPYKSPKEFIFPQVEKLLSFNEQGEPLESEPGPLTVIFGIKPCDLEALRVTTTVFTHGQFPDVYYQQNLERTILIGHSCLQEKPGCFCKQRGLDPGYSPAGDVFLIETEGDDFYRVELLTEKGRNVFKDFKLEEVSGMDRKSTAGKSKLDNTERILELQGNEIELFLEVNWDAIAEKCLGCGVCTYLCPTCHCFELKDETEGGNHYRYRCWDSCMFPKFTLHASGHNPRASKKERIRQRVLHKYLYLKQNHGLTGCTGCGRCLRSCPAGMNIKAIISKIMEDFK
ncbi:MAG: 4Fe-4S dicluster domain-containing protein [Firmicutes bacterium]|nr:4Fe-4S dicluster domain-containing protein [Bacillota bacterium]